MEHEAARAAREHPLPRREEAATALPVADAVEARAPLEDEVFLQRDRLRHIDEEATRGKRANRLLGEALEQPSERLFARLQVEALRRCAR